MNEPLLVAFGVTITAWKLIGYLGVALFAGRWFVQMFYSRRHGRPVGRAEYLRGAGDEGVVRLNA